MADTENFDNIIGYAGDFRLKVCRAISYKEAEGSEKAFRVNLLPQAMTISLVEDVTMPVMTGHVDVADGQDIRTLLPLTGNERLELHLFTPGQPEIKFLEGESDTFNIYKVDKIRISGGTARQQIYRIHFISREAYRNNISRISKAYAGPIENAVYEICDKELDTRKQLYLEPTATNTKFVIPNLRPFQTIKFLGSQAISKNYANAGYMFYETTEGFFFRSYESMMALGGHTAKPVIEAYAMQPANLRDDKGDKDILKDLKAPDSYSFEDVVNTLDELKHGLFANRLVTHDIYNKTIKTFDYDYHEDYGNHFHTEHKDGAKSDSNFIRPLVLFEDTDKNLSDFPMQKLMSVTDTLKVHNDYEFPRPEAIIPQTISQKAQMANFHLLLTVPGQTRITAGNMISFELPNQKPVPHDQPQELNPYYSGRYLILGLKHKFDVIEQKHIMNIRAVKDSVPTELPVGDTNMVELQEKKEAYSQYDIDENDISRS